MILNGQAMPAFAIRRRASAAPSYEVHQGDFEVTPVPFHFCVHLKLLYLARAVDVVGDGVAPCVRVGSDEIPPVEHSHHTENCTPRPHLCHQKISREAKESFAQILQNKSGAKILQNKSGRWAAHWSPMIGVTSISNLAEDA